MSTTYSIENAKSGKATCKKCKEKILIGKLRIGQHSDGGDFKITRWFHVGCFSLPRKLKKDGVTVESFLEDHIDDESTDLELSDQTKLSEIASRIKSGPKKKIDGGAGDPSTALIATLKRNAIAIVEEDDGQPHNKKFKASSTVSQTDQVYASAYLKYATLKTDELKDILRWNNQYLSGNKSSLLYRVIDGNVNGRLGFCRLCMKGRLQLSDDGSKAICRGYFDEGMAGRVTCYNTIEVANAPRLKPWFSSEPSETELEEMKSEAEKLKGEEGNSVPTLLAAKAEHLDWNVSNPKGMKKAAKDILEVCSSTSHLIDLPEVESKARIEIGKIILQNTDKSAVDIVQLVIDKFDFKQTKIAAAKVKSEARSSMCANSANVSILDVFMELSELYFKEKNTNAGVSYKKVSEAIKGIDFKINKDNAKGLGKGKTKVPGIGKASADKIYEFLTTGTIQKLEEKRAAAA